jgi:hypothetical protein
MQLNPTATLWTPPTKTPVTPHNNHDEAEQHDTGSDANLNTNDTDDDIDPLTDLDPLDEEFHAINTFVNNLIGKTPRRSLLTPPTQADLPDSCLDMSAYCTQNAHGLWQLATDSDSNCLANQLRNTTQFEHLIASMKSKCLDIYFLQDI